MRKWMLCKWIVLSLKVQAKIWIAKILWCIERAQNLFSNSEKFLKIFKRKQSFIRWLKGQIESNAIRKSLENNIKYKMLISIQAGQSPISFKLWVDGPIKTRPLWTDDWRGSKESTIDEVLCCSPWQTMLELGVFLFFIAWFWNRAIFSAKGKGKSMISTLCRLAGWRLADLVMWNFHFVW